MTCASSKGELLEELFRVDNPGEVAKAGNLREQHQVGHQLAG
jgi:hypothetical protein